MNKEKLAEKISEWEISMGESFQDYFMHDNIKDSSWGFWLIGKGFKERGRLIIDLLAKGENCLDQSLLYEIHTSDVYDLESNMPYGDYEQKGWNEENYNKDVLLWAEFLTETDYYLNKVMEFLKDDDESN